ncbi:MAG TPA: hypothetical protein VKY92_27125 [Verrucomicrobiae bacterium]|jgi:DNA-binding PadR family transcriptional regulator|nr:hypothetical protein [Verrucomicrobiae bacterium]
MDADERDICLYLKGFPGQFIAYKEISRRAAGKRRYRDEPDWATPVLTRMVEKGLIESDSGRHYRLKPRKKVKQTRWVSPEIKQILEKSGMNVETVFEINEEDKDDLTRT